MGSHGVPDGLIPEQLGDQVGDLPVDGPPQRGVVQQLTDGAGDGGPDRGLDGGVGSQLAQGVLQGGNEVLAGEYGQGECIGGLGDGRDDPGAVEEVSGHGVDQADECGADNGVGHQGHHRGTDLIAHHRDRPQPETLVDRVGHPRTHGVLDGGIGEQFGDQ